MICNTQGHAKSRAIMTSTALPRLHFIIIGCFSDASFAADIFSCVELAAEQRMRAS